MGRKLPFVRGNWRDELDSIEPEQLPVEAQKRNAYVCGVCGGFVVTVDRHEGVTPMFLACRVKGEPRDPLNTCSGQSMSSMYRFNMFIMALQAAQREQAVQNYPTSWPEPSWEWYRPSARERKGLRRGQDHVDKGGLLLRRIEEADDVEAE